MLTGSGAALGPSLVRHPAVAKVAFIVFDDVDLDQVVEAPLGVIYGNAGQDCCARGRAFVHRDVHDAIVERWTARGRHEARHPRTEWYVYRQGVDHGQGTGCARRWATRLSKGRPPWTRGS